ncbi:MAG: cytochrome c oxidase subunit 3 [Chloroflexota bacterium]
MADMTLNQDTMVSPNATPKDPAQDENRKFAMWLYLASEIVIFSILIAGYAIFRATQGTVVDIVHKELGIALVTANTFILLASSYAMVMGLRAIELGDKPGFYKWIGATAVLGTIFVGGQYIEYSELGHLEISLNDQEFTVATTLFEGLNEVEAVVLTTTTDNDSGAVLETTSATLDAREATLPVEETVTVGDEITATEIVSSYIVDFENESEILEGISLADRTIEWDENYILLDTEGSAITGETAINNELIAINGGVRDRDVSLDRLAVTDIDGNLVAFSTIVGGQAIEVDPAQYDTLNDYFRIMLGNSASDFGMRFYAPTAFHGAHVIIGVIWALLILWRGYRGFYDENAIGVEMFGLYWHFVDVVWIVLFTLIYLV